MSENIARVRFILLGLAIILPSWNGHSAKTSRKPNFVVIFCDDLRYGDLGCFGHPTVHTSHLDRMAAEGQKWTNFYVGASVCTPSRATLLNGRLPIRNGMMSVKRRVLFPDSSGSLTAGELTILNCSQLPGTQLRPWENGIWGTCPNTCPPNTVLTLTGVSPIRTTWMPKRICKLQKGRPDRC